MVSVVFSEETTGIQQTTGLPQLDHVRIVRFRVEMFLVRRATGRVATEGIFDPIEVAKDFIGVIRNRSTPPV